MIMDLAPDHGEKAVCDERLWAFIQGNLDPAEALLIATHCSLCAEVATRLKQLMSCAASVMEEHNAQKMHCTGAEFFDRHCKNEDRLAIKITDVTKNIPKSLQTLCGDQFEDVKWHETAPGFAKNDLFLDGSRMTTMLYKVSAGSRVPEHHHPNGEIVLVLSGLMRDGEIFYKVGEVSIHRADTVEDSHAPEAVEDSICLAVRG